MDHQVITLENCTANAAQSVAQRQAEQPAPQQSWIDKLAGMAARFLSRDREGLEEQLQALQIRLHQLPDVAIEEKRIAQIEYGARLKTIDAWRDQEAAQIKREMIELQARLEIMK